MQLQIYSVQDHKGKQRGFFDTPFFTAGRGNLYPAGPRYRLPNFQVPLLLEGGVLQPVHCDKILRRYQKSFPPPSYL